MLRDVSAVFSEIPQDSAQEFSGLGRRARRAGPSPIPFLPFLAVCDRSHNLSLLGTRAKECGLREFYEIRLLRFCRASGPPRPIYDVCSSN